MSILTKLTPLSVDKEKENYYVELKPWKLYFDGSRHQNGVGIGVLIISPDGEPTKIMFELNYECSNNETEYEALILGLEILLNRGMRNVKIIGDS